MTIIVCENCKGSYPDVQRDGSPSTHGCPPLSEWEKKALSLPIIETVERTADVKKQLASAASAEGVSLV